jgi:hypothetical protein
MCLNATETLEEIFERMVEHPFLRYFNKLEDPKYWQHKEKLEALAGWILRNKHGVDV